MGAILGALIGRHLEHAEEQHQTDRKIALTNLFGHLADPTDPRFTPEGANIGLQLAVDRHMITKGMANSLKIGLATAKEKWQAKQDLNKANRDAANAPPAPGSEGTNLGMPAPPNAVQQEQGQSAILQRLLPALMAAKPQQQPGGMQGAMQGTPGVPPVPGTTPPGLSQGNAPGMPGAGLVPPAPPQYNFAQPPPGAPPFANGGAGAGPAPPLQGEKPEMRAASDTGTQGFNVPPPAAQVAQDAGPPTGLYPYRNEPSATDVAAIKGRVAALTAGPQEEQSLRLNRENQAALYQQTQAQKIAEQQRILGIIHASDEYKKAPPLQKLEIDARVMGMQGAISPMQRLMNLPKSAIPNSEFPEGTLDEFGRELDRSPGKWSNQQQDPNTRELRAIATTPTLHTMRLLTDTGPVVVSIDPRGNFINAKNEVNGSPIVDPRLLETIRNTVENRSITTVGADGKPVTTIVQVPKESTSQRVLPAPPGGAAGAGGAAAPGGAAPAARPAARTGGPVAQAPAATGGGGPRIVATYPKALTAATQRTAEFAQSVQKHIPRIEGLIDDLDKTGDLGVVASRWNDFMAGKVGAGDPRFSALQTNLGMFSSALAVAHQTRGVQIMQHFKEMADAGKLTPETLRSNFAELKSWIDTYAGLGSNRPGAVNAGGRGGAINNPPPGTPQARKPLEEFFK